jgi:hypothetical protein
MIEFFVACGNSYPARHDVARIPSADTALQALVIELETAATDSTIYEVHLVAAGTRASEIAVARIDKADKPSVRWTGERAIEIKCNNARVLHYQNFSTVLLGGKDFAGVSVALSCGNAGYTPS